MQVREATEADAAAIRSVAESSMEASYSLSPQAIEGAVSTWYDDDTLGERLADEDVLLLVGETDDGIVAFAECELVDRQGDILWLHVDPMHRGQKIGEQMFDRTREELELRGAETLRGRVLADNTEGNAFYEHQGLELAGQSTVEIDDEEFIENIYVEKSKDTMMAFEGPEGAELFVDRADSDRGSKGAFMVVYSDGQRDEKYGYFCANCESLVTAMDSMGRMECEECGNVRKPTRWDAAHM